MIFANRIIISHTLQKRTRHPVANISDRPSTFYDKALCDEFHDNYPFDGETRKSEFHHPPANIPDEPSTFYDKTLYDEFRTQFSFNFQIERAKRRIFKK
ncbi:MAG: hypothetical protein IJR82_00900 [Bacilli bacterium]|nr:hypothetical protein [Bacilli bacterium]